MSESEANSSSEINKVYCQISGVKFYLIDSFGLRYQAESAQIHPLFLDSMNLRAILKYEWNKTKNPSYQSEKLFNTDWQDISLGKESDYQVPKEKQLLAKSFIAGIVLAQMHSLGLTVRKELSGKQMHEINLSLCAHWKRAKLLWYARRLVNFPHKHFDRINLDTVWDQWQGAAHRRLNISKSIATYLSSVIEDDSERLPRRKGRKQSSITIYSSSLPSGRRLKNADKPLNGTRVDWGLKKASEAVNSLKASGVLTKKQHSAIYYTMLNWADVTDSTLNKLGSRLQELADQPILKDEYKAVLERVGIAFATGEIKMVGHAANYTLGERFLDEPVREATRPAVSLMEKLKERKDNPKTES